MVRYLLLFEIFVFSPTALYVTECTNENSPYGEASDFFGVRLSEDIAEIQNARFSSDYDIIQLLNY